MNSSYLYWRIVEMPSRKIKETFAGSWNDCIKYVDRKYGNNAYRMKVEFVGLPIQNNDVFVNQA